MDDPTQGLRPVACRSLVESMIYLTRRSDRTIFFSSHQLADVERVADYIAVLDRSVLRVCCPLEAFRKSVQQVRLRFPRLAAAAARNPGPAAGLPVGRANSGSTCVHYNGTTERGIAGAGAGGTGDGSHQSGGRVHQLSGRTRARNRSSFRKRRRDHEDIDSKGTPGECHTDHHWFWHLHIFAGAGLPQLHHIVFQSGLGTNGLAMDDSTIAQPLLGSLPKLATVFCAIFGAVLGWLQIHNERHRDLWAPSRQVPTAGIVLRMPSGSHVPSHLKPGRYFWST